MTDPAERATTRLPEPTALHAGELAMRDRLRTVLFDAPSHPPRLGRYVVVGTLGRGGLGVVYVAHDPELDRNVAIKLVGNELDRTPSVRERLRREAQALAKLSHPNVVAVHDVGEDDGEVFLAMELVEGRTLSEWAREQPRSWPEIRDVLVGTARGLHAAHKAGLVHRDVKPGNVIVDREERARVLDFGLARAERGSGVPASSRAIDGDLTEAESLVGTPAYMAPEQFAGGPIDARTDQWGLCVTAYELLYGRRPFTASALTELRDQVERADVPAPPAGTTVPVWLHRVIVRGLQREPADRWPDLDVFVQELVRERPRRSARVLVGALAVTLLGAAAVVGFVLPTSESTCEGRVRVSGFHAQWSTPNQIRWTWTVDAGDVDALHEYRVLVGPSAGDVESRSSAVRVYDAAQNPELAFFQLPGTTGSDRVEGTITDGLDPQADYAARLLAIDQFGCETASEIAIERTAPSPKQSIALFSDELRGSTFPAALRLVEDADAAFAGGAFLEYRSVDDPECPDPAALCYQNLSLRELGITARLGAAYEKNAYLELAIVAGTPASTWWANIILEADGGRTSFDGWTVRSEEQWRVVQIPLRAMLGPPGTDPPHRERTAIDALTIGGAWGHGATIRLDEIRIRY